MGDIKRKLCAALIVAAVLLMGIACGGGSSGVVWPVLPEGELYLYEEGMGGGLGGEYIPVTEDIDNSFYQLPANPAETIWGHGFFFWQNCYGEDGFILAIEPDEPEADAARISVALHPRGMNFTQETVDFMEEDPENIFVVMNIMAGLEGGNAGGVLTRGTVASDVYITAGGSYEREMKEGAQEMVDGYYANIPFPLNLFITKEQFQAYLSQQLYNSTYVGGERVSLTELLGMFLEPWNWNRTDFKVTLDLTSAVFGMMENIEAAEGASGDYDQRNLNNLALGNRIYRGGGDAGSYRAIDFPLEIGGRQIIRTRPGDAGWEGDEFLFFDLTRPVVLYLAVDSSMDAESALVTWLAADGWTLWEGETVTARMSVSPYSFANFNLYHKNCEAGEVILPGNADEEKQMYFVLADAGTYPLGMDIIVTAHGTLMQDNPAGVVSYLPAVKEEGGIVVNENGITEDVQSGLPLAHADFVTEFDANVFVNTEGGSYGLQNAVGDVAGVQFVEHVLKNNGFRLIDTYNDQYPAFGGESQVLQVERMLGFGIDPPIRVPLLEEELFSFTNMNLLNSPNLIGVYVKSVATDDENIVIWKDEPDDRGMDVWNIRDYLRDNALGYRYYISRPGEEVTLAELLQRIGKSAEGELTFRVLVELPEGKTFELAGGAFNHDYFTNVYDAAIGGAAPLEIVTEIKEVY